MLQITKLETFRACTAPLHLFLTQNDSVCFSSFYLNQTTFHERAVSFLGCTEYRKMKEFAYRKVKEMRPNGLLERTTLQQSGWDMFVINSGQPKEKKKKNSSSALCPV